ncbi:hypothetical protein [Phenylobacterium sp.]|uniref:hypothetical protein n=1 Tax=Phenylobacterium sp. TaxID=1871053 RepID=UPI0035B44FBE
MRYLIPAAVAALSISGAAQAQQIVPGTGKAPITRDVETVRAQAEADAKVDLVRNLVIQTLGAERLNELSPEVLQRLARQIRPDMIVDRSSQRLGKEFQVTLSARVEQAWFQGLLDNEQIKTSVARAGGAQTRILLMLDEAVGAAQDYAKPAEIVTEYDRQTGASFSDRSVSAYSEKDRSASTFKGASASQRQGSMAVGYSDAYGSAAGRASGSSASAARVQSAQASSRSVSSVDKTDVQAEVHDNERFRQRITYQTAAANGPSRFARSSLSEELKRYDVELADERMVMSSYFNGAPPTFESLSTSPRFEPFLRVAAQRGMNFFMGGGIRVEHAGTDAATGQFVCTGSLYADAYASSTGEHLASGKASGEAYARTNELCQAKLAETLSQKVALSIGPSVQNHWRTQTRNQAETVALAAGPVDYTLTVRGGSISMAMQADLLDALSSTSGVEKHVFLSQTPNQVSFQVRYNNSLPLQVALFQKLRTNPAFAQMQPTVDGRSVTLCLSGC